MPPSTTRRATAVRFLLSLGLLAVGGASFLMLGRASPTPTQPPQNAAPEVEVRRVPHHEGSIEFSVDGVVAPYREVKIAAEATGRIVHKADNCRVGRVVQLGERLMQIDPRDYKYHVDRLEQQLAEAENRLVELAVQIRSAKQQLQLAEEDVTIQKRFVARLERLVKSNATSKNDLDTARRNELNSRIALQTQRDQLQLYQARKRGLQSNQRRIYTELNQARVELDRTEIYSPLDGVITEEHAEQDSYVQEGTTVLVIRDGSRLDVRCSLQTNEMHWLWAAQGSGTVPDERAPLEFPETPVRVVYKIDQDEFAWDGVLARYDGGGVDSQTRMIPCRVHVLSPEVVSRVRPAGRGTMASPPTLMVGMFVEVRVQVTPHRRLLRLPVAAVHPGKRVWVVAAGKLDPRQVEVAASYEDEILVYEGADALVGGELVVVSPLASPQAGDVVVAQEAP